MAPSRFIGQTQMSIWTMLTVTVIGLSGTFDMTDAIFIAEKLSQIRLSHLAVRSQMRQLSGRLIVNDGVNQASGYCQDCCGRRPYTSHLP
jgi:hypothetical protein